MKSILCKLGFHKWNRATYVSSGFRSNILDWKQSCKKCGKQITWIQPKGINKRFYPVYWIKRRGLLFVFLIIIIILLLIFILM